ncbi:MAG TPA: hypothetical protein VH518_10750 [Tepidisphaeraceae bacterium]
MNRRQGLIVLLISACFCVVQGCTEKLPQYGAERQLYWPGARQQVWAVAPAVDLSGQRQVDPLLQGDLLFQQLQQVSGITAIPVNRVVEVYSSLRIEKVQSEEQAALVCDLLGCDALLVPTVTAYDPYNPPKFGAALQMFAHGQSYVRPAAVDVRELARRATPPPVESVPPPQQGSFVQVVGVFDAANGSVRDAVNRYASGRSDPSGPLGNKEYFVSMDRYCGFVYHSLIEKLISEAGHQ